MARTTVRIEGGPDWNSHQRGGWIVLWLWQGSRLSNRDIARLCGMTPQNAGRTMAILSAAFPIVSEGGFWHWMDKEDKEGK